MEMPFTEALAKKQAAIDAMRLQKAQALEGHCNLWQIFAFFFESDLFVVCLSH